MCLQAVEEFRVAHPDRTIGLDTHGDGRGVWDADRLIQLVSNLVGNALAYGAADRPVRVTSRVDGTAGVLTVHNEGAAIPPERIATISEPPHPMSTQGGGARPSSGLGLYIVHAIVRAHGGALRVESTSASGTTFTITLPCAACTP